MKKYTLEEIKEKFPDYKAYLKLLKKIKFKRIKDDIGLYDNNVFMGVEHENKYINSDVEEVLVPKFFDAYCKKHNTKWIDGSHIQELEEEMEEYLNKLPDFLNFLIKQL